MSTKEKIKMKVALLGDSIFDNRRYVNFDREDVEHVLKESGVDCKLYALDGAVIKIIPFQIEEMKKEIDSISSVFLSVGGNDGLGALHLIQQNLSTDEFFNSFKEQLNDLYSDIYKFKNSRNIPVHVLNIYYPCFDFAGSRMLEEIRNPQFRDVIIQSVDRLNEVIKETATKYSFGFIDINSEFNEPQFYANEIEPSYEGSKLLTKLIRRVI